jgi:hypothetical protein
VADVDEFKRHLLLATPVPGVAFIASEGRGDMLSASVWSYLDGPGAAEIVERKDGLGRGWLSALGA